jgi:hypothetical protein
VKAEKGTGKAEEAEPGATSQNTPRMSPTQWVLPKNHQEIYDAITGGLPAGLSLTSQAPLTTVAEMLNRPATHETIVHFVNFDRQHRLSPFKASVRKQFAGKVASVTCLSPDLDDPLPLKFKESGGQVSFTVPAMRIYSMVVIRHASAE